MNTSAAAYGSHGRPRRQCRRTPVADGTSCRVRVYAKAFLVFAGVSRETGLKKDPSVVGVKCKYPERRGVTRIVLTVSRERCFPVKPGLSSYV